MERIIISEIYKLKDDYIGKKIKVMGWVRANRANAQVGFIDLNDGSSFKGLQIVFNQDLPNYEQITKLGLSASIEVFGNLIKSEGAGQAFELVAESISIIGDVDEDYPIQKKQRPTVDFLRTIAHLRPRTNTFSAVFRVRSMASFAIHNFFKERNFVYTHTPIITSLDAEGAGEMFKVTTMDLDYIAKNNVQLDYARDFFARSASLTVTGQLQAEAYALAFGSVYTFGPTFRAENSNTTRHLAEFWMMEPEIAFADLNDCIKLIEDMVKYITKFVLDELPNEMAFFNQFIEKGLLARLDNVINSDFARITYTEAIEKLLESKHKFEHKVEWGMDLKTEHEKYITEVLFKKPVFVTDYPKDIKAFYMRLNDDNKTIAGVDLLVPGIGELVGGSQREERLDKLIEAMKYFGLNPDEYWWYTDLRRFGGAPHSGFGLGFERFIMYITGIANIRDTIPFPRTVKNAEF